jgi:glutamate formiminotransferase
MPLVAYNINLATNRLDVARNIAAGIRHSSGGYRFVKAMAVKLDDRGIVQVSMNLTNYEKTPIFRVFETVKREAARYGVTVLESEIVGLVPSAALMAAAAFYLQIEGFNAAQVLETKLRAGQ